MSQTHIPEDRLPENRIPDGLSDVERQILQSVQDIKYGSVEILIHDSRIVQVEKSEKFRFDTKRAPVS